VSGIKLDEAIDQVRAETGARMFVLGEEHSQTNSVQYIRDSLNDLKSKNINTLYVEMPSDMQPLLDKALQGDPASQRDLRLKHEQWWFYGGTDAAQQRYDLLFDANKAGIKVQAIDMSSRMDHMHRYNQLSDKPSDALSARIGIDDPVIARNIERLDDGGQAILLIGKGHTYKYSEDGHVENTSAGWMPVYQSAHGGIDQRLNDRGIKAASIDFNTIQEGDISLDKGDGQQSDFEISIPGHVASQSSAYHISAGYRVYWDRLATIYEQAGTEASVSGDAAKSQQYDKAAHEISGLSKTLDDPRFLKMTTDQQVDTLKNKLDKVNRQIEPLEIGMDNEILQYGSMVTRTKWLMPKDGETSEQTFRKVVQDNQSLNTPESRALWQKDPMKLAEPEAKPLADQPEQPIKGRDLNEELKNLMSSGVVGSIKSSDSAPSANSPEYGPPAQLANFKP
jgi:hypothetical protein